MDQIFMGLGRFLEYTFQILVVLGWVPVILISLTLALGMVYWLMLQRRYSEEARRRGTLI